VHEHAGCRDHQRRLGRREGRDLREQIEGVPGEHQRRFGCRDRGRGPNAFGTTVLPGPDQTREPVDVAAVAHVERREIDAGTPDDLGMPHLRHPLPHDLGDELHLRGSRRRIEPHLAVGTDVAVRVAVGIQAQPRARPHLQQRDRTFDTRQRRKKHRAPQGLVRLHRAGKALGDDSVSVLEHPRRPRLGGHITRAEQPAHREHERRLTTVRRQPGEDLLESRVVDDTPRPGGVQVGAPGGLVSGETPVSLDHGG